MEITPEQIATRAYERFVERGGEHGHDVEDWLAAKADLQRSWQLYDVELVDPGGRRIEVVRTIRDLTGMGLRDIEDVVDAPPGRLWRASFGDAETLKMRLEALGARVALHALAGR
jgi:ribosomal protein L7/L12